MDTSHGAVALSILGLLACTNSGQGASPDADPFRPDATILQCDMNSAQIGRCELANGSPCTGVPEEQRVFVPLSSGDAVPMVVGPQAASMFVLALQTSGIFAGDANNPASPDNPKVELMLTTADDKTIARYRGRPYFETNAERAEMLDTPGLFIIIEGDASRLVGEQVQAIARLTDKDGVERCSSIMFVADR